MQKASLFASRCAVGLFAVGAWSGLPSCGSASSNGSVHPNGSGGDASAAPLDASGTATGGTFVSNGGSSGTGSGGAGGTRASDGAAGPSPNGIPPAPPGSPSVLVGWYTAGWNRSDSSSDAYFQSLADAGANFLITNQPATETGDPGFSSLIAYLDKAASHHVQVVLGLPMDTLQDTDPNLGKLKSFVTAVKGHPALWGYNVDEPDGGSVSAAQMAKAYGALKSIDSKHPLENKVLNSGYSPYCDFTGQAPGYAPYMDLGGRDVYPIGPNSDPTKYNYYPLHPPSDEFTIAVPKQPHGAGGAFLATLIADDCAAQAKAESKLPPIIDLQGVGTGAGYRDPTYLETRYMLFTTLIRDVSGVAYWVDYKAFNTPVQGTVNSVIKEATQVGAYLKAGTFGDPSVTVTEPRIGYRAAHLGSAMVIFAVDESEKGDQPLSGTLPAPPPTFPKVTFTLPSGLKAASVDVALDALDEGTGKYAARSLALSQNPQDRYEFTDAFTPYQVHIYNVTLQ
jgi:hypothetical protein